MIEYLNCLVDCYIGIITLFGILLGLLPFLFELKKNSLLIRKQKRETWNQISLCNAAIRTLEFSKFTLKGRKEANLTYEQLEQQLNKHSLSDIEAIKAMEVTLLTQYRNLLSIAVSLERNYTLEVINKWYVVGKLASPWNVRQALLLLESKKIKPAHFIKYKELLDFSKSEPKDNSKKSGSSK